jgi:hypothetical protein
MMIPSDSVYRSRLRLRRSRVLLLIAAFVHGTTFVIAVLAVVAGEVRPLVSALAVAVLVVGPPVALIRWERTASSSTRPAMWVRRAVGVAVPHQVGFALAATAHWELRTPSAAQWGVLAATPLTAELLAVALASRALRKPFTSELGGMEVDVLAKIRSSNPRVPAFLSNDEAVLTGTALVITVRPNLKRKFVETIALRDVVDVDVCPGTTGEPWFFTEDDRTHPTPPGDVVRVVHRSGVRSIPVEDPTGFANVLRARVEVIRAHLE